MNVPVREQPVGFMKGPIHVLVVDDDEFLKMALKLGLERSGCSVGLAATVGEAVKALTASHYDVLVTDLCIGAESGLTLVAEARTLSPGTHVFLMSGSLSALERDAAFSWGAIAVLEKPFTPSTLAGIIHGAARSPRAPCVNEPTGAKVSELP